MKGPTRFWIDLRPHSNARAQGFSNRHTAWAKPIVRFGVQTVCVMPVVEHQKIIAAQSKVIEKLKEQRAMVTSFARSGEYVTDDDIAEMDQEIEAIENEAGK